MASSGEVAQCKQLNTPRLNLYFTTEHEGGTTVATKTLGKMPKAPFHQRGGLHRRPSSVDIKDRSSLHRDFLPHEHGGERTGRL